MDAPDEISEVLTVYANHDSIKIKWEAPDCHNSAITAYKVYLSNKEINLTNGAQIVGEKGARMVAEVPPDTLELRIDGLKAQTAYFVYVTAVNEHGEGYRTERPQLIMTQAVGYNEPTRMYVWGSNSCSELGLSAGLVEDH